MNEVIRTIFLCFICAGIISMQMDFEADKTGTRVLRDTLELAAHDGALQLDSTYISEGKVVFNQSLAEQAIMASLQRNLKLDSSLTPEPDSYFEETINLIYLEYLDDSNTAVFPLNYHNSQFEILEVVTGPSIVAVIETTSKRFGMASPITLRQAVVYEYIK